MKYLVVGALALTTFTAQAKVPLLLTDLEEQQVLVRGGISKTSHTSEVESALLIDETTETDISGTAFSFGLTGDSQSVNGLTPVLLLDLLRLNPENTNEHTTRYNLKAGFTIPSGSSQHVVTAFYQDYSDSGIRSSIGAEANLRLKSGTNNDRAIDLLLGLELEENTDDVKGGDELTVALKGKTALSKNLYTTLSAGLDIKTDKDYSNGLVKEASPGLNAEFGLHVLANRNADIEFKLAYYAQENETYNESNTLLASENLDGISFGLDFTLAF